MERIEIGGFTLAELGAAAYCTDCSVSTARRPSSRAPKLSASWEGFVIEQVLTSEPRDQAWFWATHQGAEIDLLLRRGDRLLGAECKRADARKLTPSIRTPLADFGLERVAVVYPSAKRYALSERAEAVPLETLANPGGSSDGAGLRQAVEFVHLVLLRTSSQHWMLQPTRKLIVQEDRAGSARRHRGLAHSGRE